MSMGFAERLPRRSIDSKLHVILVDNLCVEDFDLIVFDDGGGRWGPMTDLRAVFELRSGALTTRQRIEHVVGRTTAALYVSEPMQGLVAQRDGEKVNRWDATTSGLMVSGRWLGLDLVDPILRLGTSQVLIKNDGQIVAARVTSVRHAELIARGEVDSALSCVETDRRVLVDKPSDPVMQLHACLRADLPTFDITMFDRSTASVPTIGEEPILVAPGAKLHPMVVINSEKGPVVIDDGATVGSFAVIAGPCYIGRQTVIAPHAHIRSNTVIGCHCVVGGEVSESVVDSYTNKCHGGYLGHSLVGQWANLGAQTTVSNLKNTYGQVRVQLEADSAAEDTGTNKLGPVIGDYVRTAIGTRIMTGSCIGTGSMLAVSGFVPKYVDRFTFLTDRGAQPCDIDRFFTTASRMMARRRCELSPAERERLSELVLRSAPVSP